MLLDNIDKLKAFGVLSDFFKEVEQDDGVFLAGGAVREAVCGVKENIADYDVFFSKKDKAKPLEYKLVAKGFNVTFRCPIGKLTSLQKGDMKVQLITENEYQDMESLIKEFDITACMMATDGKEVLVSLDAVKDATSKTIRINKTDFPKATMKRVEKYINKGYRLDNQAVNVIIDTVHEAGFRGENLDGRFYID